MRQISPLRYRWPFIAKLFFFFLLIVTLVLPIPYVFFRPGNPNDLSGRLLEISGAKSYAINGNLYITSILVSNPDAPILGAETLYTWATGENVVLPREQIYPTNLDENVIQRDSRDEMSDSKIAATAAALNFLGYEFEPVFFIKQLRVYTKATELQIDDRIVKVDGKTIREIEEIRSAYSDREIGEQITILVERLVNGKSRLLEVPVELVPNQELGGDPTRPAIGILVGTSAKFPVDIKFGLRGVGGPSAGLIFAIGIVDKLTSEDLIRGRKIAGTGSINPDGTVEAIGGIEQKLIGASRKGATLFLAPRMNCDDIVHVPKGLKVIPVSTLTEAVAALLAPDNFKFPTC
jgi:PDZ domain-containing protein